MKREESPEGCGGDVLNGLGEAPFLESNKSSLTRRAACRTHTCIKLLLKNTSNEKEM